MKFYKLAAAFLAAVIGLSALGPANPAKADEGLAPLSNSVALYVGSPNSLVNGEIKQIDENTAVTPYIESGRTMLPIGFIGSTLGFKVNWNEKTKQVTLEKDSVKLEFTLGSKIMKENGKNAAMDTPAASKNGRTFLPVSYVAKALGLKISYDRGLVILDPAKEFSATADKAIFNAAITKLSGLPIVGTMENYSKLMSEMSGKAGSAVLYGTNDMAKASDSSAAEAQTEAGRGSNDYSQTNIQVEGVDESDVVKTDGEYVYHLVNNKLYILKAYPANEMKELSVIDFAENDRNLYASEMYVDGDRLAVITNETKLNETNPKSSQSSSADSSAASDRMIMPYGTNLSGILVYDISDKSNPVLDREFSVEGSAVTTRKIGDIIYMVINQYVLFQPYYGDIQPVVPAYYDSKDNKDRKEIDLSEMSYFPGANNYTVMMICGFDISGSAEPKISSFLGSGSQVYMSDGALYVAQYSYFYNFGILRADSSEESADNSDKTSIYRFILDDGDVIPGSSGTVDGSILNQFSMDEYEDHLRVATTIRSCNETVNALSVLDMQMDVVGKITEIAPGERIYSARFMGDTAFMVTYKQVDPLFALDLSNPKNPKIIGELKIPGYSTYLHPYDATRLIGFGQDTEVVTTRNEKGEIIDQRTQNSSLKLALFDVSDLSNPKELSTVTIGDRYTYSELLYNHKAFLFSKDKGFIAFPVTENDYTSFDGKRVPGFQGAYVFDIDSNKISLRGKITQTGSAGSQDYEKYIQRLLYIGDVLFSVSQSGLQANDLNTLDKIGYTKY